MFGFSHRRLASAFLAMALLAACAGLPAKEPGTAAPPLPVPEAATPLELYGALFRDVQMQRVFCDSKTFVDAVPTEETPEVIAARYREEKRRPGFDLTAFVYRHFTIPRQARLPGADGSGCDRVQDLDVCSHIDVLWPELTRFPEQAEPHSSLLPLPEPYVVPGGRFDEIYYWDSYFTMLGLQESGRDDVVLGMVRNFASLIDRYGHVPNGNRSYYLSRSQPPFFAPMVALVAESAPDPRSVYAEFLPAMSREYAFWMEGGEGLAPGRAHRRVVRLKGGALLNRYWDDKDSPREESYHEDVETAERSNRPRAAVYRDLRAGAESGWDFSSRWLEDNRTLATIRTTAFLPVDLNSIMVKLETTLAEAYAVTGEAERAAEFRGRAEARKAAIRRYFWNEEKGFFADHLWRENRTSDNVTAATLVPLYFGIATPEQARRVAALVRARLLHPGGLITSPVVSGEQWDAPNGWAPLQWMAIQGLNDYGESALAATIAERWMTKVIGVYEETGRLLEKYDVVDPTLVTGGGEYPTQDGFGWTNGVLRKLLALYPEAVAPLAGTRWCAAPPAKDNTPPTTARPLSGHPSVVAR